ncbi:biosynthetic-type acetolactate synthase large subunit [Hominifimenecus sp. rT4P-3]|uniref:biosynthetic-type acetolactate synthase large subunit n=1 Tax=Hominifimenecus sp. rT4P-3 TaxID=3242979 RepID=UPI003DA4CF26
MRLTGSQIIMECLLEQGVDTIFGYPGGTVLNIYDALYEYSDRIHHILTSHEQGASHAADGYARATGRVGVCFATSGPGATNLVTGIATAYMDSIPLVAITANVAVNALGKDSFQEIDIAGVTMPITKYSTIIKNIEELAPAIRKAFRLARTGRPGPVLIDVTKDVTAAVTEFYPVEPEPIRRQAHTIREEDIEKVLEMIEAAERPYIFAGGGVIASDASEELTEFVHKMDAPITCTLMAQGTFDQTDPAYTGMLGMHGTKTSNLGVSDCDLLIGVGVRFSDRCTGNPATFAQKAKVLQLDVDAAEINKNVRTDASVIGDLKVILQKLNERLKEKKHLEWMQKIEALKEQHPLFCPDGVLTGPYVIRKLSEITGGDAIITTDVGQHQMWSAQFYMYRKPRTFISSGGLGTMGYGVGASIGAKYAFPDKLVVNITGDGCFRMNMNELATITRNNLPIVTIILNNHVLGMVRQWQTLFYEKRYSHTILEDKIDFVKIAEAMGAKGYRVTKPEEVESVLREAIALNAPVVVECIIDSDDKVFPMVAPGGQIAEVFSEEDLEEKK